MSAPHQNIDDLADLITRLELKERLTLVLHDWGGAIGLATALRRPEQIGRLVLFNTAAFPPPKGKKLPWRLRVIRNTRNLAQPAVLGANLFVRAALKAGDVGYVIAGIKNLHDLHVGRSAQRLNLLVLRDPFNWLASRLKIGFLDIRGTGKRTMMDLWLDYAREFVGETSAVPGPKGGLVLVQKSIKKQG